MTKTIKYIIVIHIFKEIFKTKHILVAYLNVLLDLNLSEDDIEYHHSEMKMDIKELKDFDKRIAVLENNVNILKEMIDKMGGN